MSKIVSTKKINAGFLAIVLIIGTFAAISPSFMTGAQAFLMDDNYESDYGMNSYDGKQSYEKDNNYYKSKDSSSNVKCNNFNVNGLGINALPPALNGLATDETQAAAEEGEVGASSSGSDGGRSSGSNTDFRGVCIYNNIPPEPCAEADDIEACFEENLLPEDFELLTNALENGITVEIEEGNFVSLNSFADICEALKGVTTWFQLFDALLNIAEELSDPTNPVAISGELVDCIAEALGIPLPPPPPEG